MKQQSIKKRVFFSTRYIILVVIIIISAITFYIYRAGHCQHLDCITFEGKNKYREKEIYTHTDGKYRALYESDSSLLRADVISNINESDANTEINARTTRVQAFFETAPAPYPGEISDEISCGDEFIPTFSTHTTDSVHISYYTGYLNQRLNYTSCSEEQFVYKGATVLFYCPSSMQLYQLEFINQITETKQVDEIINKIINTIRCNS